MISEAWDGVQVSNHTVAVTIGEIKQVLGEYGSWISCQPRFGYRVDIIGGADPLRLASLESIHPAWISERPALLRGGFPTR